MADNVGLRIIDVTEPSHTHLTGTLNFSPNRTLSTYDITIAGNYAYIANYDSGLCIMNISDSSNLFQVSRYHSLSRVNAVAVSGNFAYLAAAESGLVILDISDPGNPQEIGVYREGGCWLCDVQVSGSYVYFLDMNNSKFVIIDVSDPSNPQYVGEVLAMRHDQPMHLAISGNYAFMSCTNIGLQVINFVDRSHPQIVGYYRASGLTMGVSVAGNYACLTDFYNFGIYDCSEALGVVDRISDAIPKAFSLKQNFPNPFNTTTTIEYTIPKSGKVELKLIDVTGREVGTLVNFNQNPGTYHFQLNAGNLPSGIYFYRLIGQGFSATRKLTLLK